jgi:hypothetical protein
LVILLRLRQGKVSWGLEPGGGADAEGGAENKEAAIKLIITVEHKPMQYNQITSLTGHFTYSTSFHFIITITGTRYVVA